MNEEKKNIGKRLPRWMKAKLPTGAVYSQVKNIVEQNQLHTICKSGLCPNIGECWNRGTATFMILGNVCTRGCKFCGVATGKPFPPDNDEPERLALAIQKMNIKHAVITSVDRDDLPDKGATLWAETIKAVKKLNPCLTMEVLIPDFDAIPELIQMVINEKPDVISHNLETVERLTPLIRSRAQYKTSLQVITQVAKSGITAKSGIMLGLGETEQEIIQTMNDLLLAGCNVMTIGQYLQPSQNCVPVDVFVLPEKFDDYKSIALKKGFKVVESGAMVRSSYHAELHIIK
jgi:lipoyl synthase